VKEVRRENVIKEMSIGQKDCRRLEDENHYRKFYHHLPT